MLLYVWVELWKCGQHPLCYCDERAEDLDVDTGFILIEQMMRFSPTVVQPLGQGWHGNYWTGLQTLSAPEISALILMNGYDVLGIIL